MVHYKRYKKMMAGDKDSDGDSSVNDSMIGIDRFKFKTSLYNPNEPGNEENNKEDSYLSSDSEVEPEEIKI